MYLSSYLSKVALSAFIFLASCSQPLVTNNEIADSVLLGGKVYTVDASRHWVQAVAIKDGKFIAVGTDEAIENYIGDKTETIQLAGQMVLPGLHDTHVHITAGKTIFSKGYCKLPDSNSNVTKEELLVLIKECRDKDPNAKGWFVGGGWPGGAFPPDGAPDKAPLDELFPDRPVFLLADSGHLVWVNSKALEIAGIDKDTLDPENGSIKRDPETGIATGTLFESASLMISSKIPPSTSEQNDAAIYRAMQHANSLGITSMFDALTKPEDLASFDRLYKSDRLPIHLRTAIWWMTDDLRLKPIGTLKVLIEKYNSDGVKTDAIKIMLDGVMEGATAAQLENYVGLDHPGKMFVSPERLHRYLIELDSLGIQVKMHGYGSLAIREGLNAIEGALKINGQNDLRHHIDHLAQADPQDYPRFAKLKTIAGFSPLWAMPNSYEIELSKNILGEERWIKSYPINSIKKLGAKIISGSDWPVSTMNPFPAMVTGITRMDPVNPDRAPLNGNEAVTLDDMIASYTIDAAFVMHQEDKTGSIEIGKSADLIILDRNIFNVSLEEVRSTKVLRTFFKGKTVYQAEE